MTLPCDLSVNGRREGQPRKDNQSCSKNTIGARQSVQFSRPLNTLLQLSNTKCQCMLTFWDTEVEVCAHEQAGKVQHKLSRILLTPVSLTCRSRKLKCDESKPRCGQCIKSSRECKPASGLTFRHQQNASLNDPDNQSVDSLKTFYAYRKTFNDNHVWLDIPAEGVIPFSR